MYLFPFDLGITWFRVRDFLSSENLNWILIYDLIKELENEKKNNKFEKKSSVVT